MADAPKAQTKPNEIDTLRAENVALHARVNSLEADVRLRDQTIARLSRPKPQPLDPNATDKFRRPL